MTGTTYGSTFCHQRCQSVIQAPPYLDPRVLEREIMFSVTQDTKYLESEEFEEEWRPKYQY